MPRRRTAASRATSSSRLTWTCWSRRYRRYRAEASDLTGMAPRIGSASEALRLVDRRGTRTGEELDQSFGGAGFRHPGSEPDREDGHGLELRRQWADDLDARHGHELGNLRGSEIDLARRQHLAGLRAGVLVLRLDLVGDPESLEDAGERHARGALPRIADRLRGEDRGFQGLRRADVGLGRAGFHRHTDPGPRDLLFALGHDLPLLRQVVDDGSRQDQHVGRRALQELRLEDRGQTVGDDDSMTGGPLEL